MKSILLCICITLSSLFFAQEFKFGDISVDQLQETKNSLDPEAEAAILYSYNRSYFPATYNEYEREIFVRIKIYDKDKADDYLTTIIPYYSSDGSSREVLSGLKAVTYNLEGGKVVETKVEKQNMFTEEKNKNVKLQKFTFPNVKNGSIIEFKYSITSPFFFNIPVEHFQYDIPLIWADYQFEHPDFLNYFTDEQGEIAPTARQTTAKTWDSRFKAEVKKFTYKNVPARKSEDFVLNPNNLKPSIRYELTSINFPGQMIRNFSSSWPVIFNDLMDSEHFGKEINNTKAVDEIVPTIINGQTTVKEKVTALLSYVQNNIKWNDYVSKYTDKGIKSALKDKEGNSADINLTLYSMLKSAGIDAYPVVLSTLYNGIINHANPSQMKLNYVIVAYYDNNELHLLDATSKYASIDQLPLRALNDRGFMMKNGAFAEIPLVNKTASRSVTSIKAKINDGVITGDYSNMKTNFLALNRIEDYEEDKEEYVKDLNDEFTQPLENVAIVNDNGNFKTNYTFKYNEDVEVLDDKIIFNPMMYLKTEKQDFSSTTRTYYIEFGTALNQIQKITFEIPEGYMIEAPLKSQPVSLPDKIVEYNYTFSQTEKTFSISTSLKINAAVFPAVYYDAFKELWKYMIEAENQFIVLKKK